MKFTYKILGLLFLLLFQFSSIFAQDDDMMNMLDAQVPQEPVYTIATFKSDRVINGQSIERMKKNQLDFRINHRFGQINSGSYDFWGLDHAYINLSLDYGITDWLQVGIRRGNLKVADGSLKFSLLRQCTGSKVIPITLSYFTDLGYNSLKITDPFIEDARIHRLAYTNQILLARKFNDKFSLQLSPTFVHRNRVDYFEQNNTYACGLSGRYKMTRRLSLTWEGFYTTSVAHSNNKYQYPVALGFDLETGGHVFQLFLTNSQYMIENQVITQTEGDVTNGGIYFGFNISRVFAMGVGKGGHRAQD
jgi:hypothetical protein